MQYFETSLEQQAHDRRRYCVTVLLRLRAPVAKHHVITGEGHCHANLVRLQHPKAAVLYRRCLAWPGQVVHRAARHGRSASPAECAHGGLLDA
jgi:hypothetical protein